MREQRMTQPGLATEGTAGAGRGERTRAALVRAAADIVVERGLRAATSRAVAAQAGVPLGAVSYHFPSKDHLLREAVLAEFSRLFAAPADAVSRAATVEEALTAQLSWLGADDLTQGQRRFLLEVLLEGGRDPRLGAVLDEALGRWRADLAALLQRLDPDLPDPEGTAAALAATLSGHLVHLVAESRFPSGPATSATTRIWRRALAAGGSGGGPDVDG